jgi:hypothetical protein
VTKTIGNISAGPHRNQGLCGLDPGDLGVELLVALLHSSCLFLDTRCLGWNEPKGCERQVWIHSRQFPFYSPPWAELLCISYTVPSSVFFG